MKVYPKMEGEDFQHANTLNNLSMAYIDCKKYTEAIDACKNALDIYEDRLLFSIGIKHQTDLDNEMNNKISEDLWRELKNNKISISQNATVLIIEKGRKWIIIDENNQSKYFVKKGEYKLNINPYPTPYAQLKNNMGNSYFLLSKHEDREKNLRAAIKAYEESLEIRNKVVFPEGYAKVRFNLGYAYEDLPGDARQQNLEKAVEAYKEAHDIFADESYWQYADKAEQRLKKANKKLNKFKRNN